MLRILVELRYRWHNGQVFGASGVSKETGIGWYGLGFLILNGAKILDGLRKLDLL